MSKTECCTFVLRLSKSDKDYLQKIAEVSRLNLSSFIRLAVFSEAKRWEQQERLIGNSLPAERLAA